LSQIGGTQIVSKTILLAAILIV
jgi:hypothetical protein